MVTSSEKKVIHSEILNVRRKELFKMFDNVGVPSEFLAKPRKLISLMLWILKENFIIL